MILKKNQFFKNKFYTRCLCPSKVWKNFGHLGSLDKGFYGIIMGSAIEQQKYKLYTSY